MTQYDVWTDLLLKRYLSPTNHGQEVYFRVDRLTLDGIGAQLGGAAGFLVAISTGPGAHTKALWPRVWNFHLTRQHNPKGILDEIGYFCFFVFAMSEHKNGDFYRSHHDTLLAQANAIADVNQIQFAEWLDSCLGRISRFFESRSGELGNFDPQQIGGMRHIGRLRAQVLITRRVEDWTSPKSIDT